MARIPRSHPRRTSLLLRERLVAGFNQGLACGEGLIAQGRGEAFDYLIGERTNGFARRAARAAAACLLLAERPVISANGNLAALCPKEAVGLARAVGAEIEVNLFYRTERRANAIRRRLLACGAKRVLGTGSGLLRMPELFSGRRKVSREGIYSADAVLLAMEDGDRTKALRKMGKCVVAIDLNPLSVTAREADITVVDNVVRAMPLIAKEAKGLRSAGRKMLLRIVEGYSNEKERKAAVAHIARRLLLIAGGKKWIG